VTLPRPTPATLVTEWQAQPVLIALIAALAVGYVAGLHRLRRTGRPWPRGRTGTFMLGLLALLWVGSGFPARYDSALYWVWTSRILVIWLVLPIVVMAGHPIQLARAAGSSGVIDRVLRWRIARIVANPLFGPALVPLLSAALFFGPVAGWAIEFPAAGWLLDLALLTGGAVMVLPLIGLDEEATSLTVGLGLAIGTFELVLDALPGIVLRLRTTLATSWFTYRDVQSWAPAPLHDQQIAGAVLWCVSEVLDLPFLLLIYRRWLQADARDAARVDTVLEAERLARRALQPEAEQAEETVERDAPWWESDPEMRERLRRQG
jgi:cytochrome c oxidase assembly factor CtaG